MKILVVLPRFPYPLEKGDKLRAYNQLRRLARSNKVYLFCTSHCELGKDDLEAVEVFCTDVKIVKASKLHSIVNASLFFLTGRSLQVGYWSSCATRKAFRKYEQEVQPDVLYCQMVRTMTWVAKSKTPKVIDFQDALSLNVRRRARFSSGLWKAILMHESKSLERAERKALRLFNRHTVISKTDRRAIIHGGNAYIDLVPNGIDSEYFAPQPTDKTTDIVFCGNMQYEPNVTAAKYLIQRVMPKVWRKMPDTTVTLAGANPAKEVQALAGKKVTVTGRVDDIRPYYLSAKIFVAPMLSGSGLQNKLLEAMSMGIPCVTTMVANSSLGASNRRDILVGKCAEATASHIVRLLGDEQLREQLSANGRHFVLKNYSWEKSVALLEEILVKAATQKKSSRQRSADGKKADSGQKRTG